MQEVKGTESQAEVDAPAATRGKDLAASSHELKPGAAWLHKHYFRVTKL